MIDRSEDLPVRRQAKVLGSAGAVFIIKLGPFLLQIWR